MFDEVHGDRVPWFLWNRELLQSSVWLVSRSLGSPTSRARPAVVLDKTPDTGPRILASDEFECLVEAEVTRQWVVMLVSEHSESEVGRVWNIDSVVEEK